MARRAARTTARATTSAAIEPTTSAACSRRTTPVESANSVSPSTGVWTGRIGLREAVVGHLGHAARLGLGERHVVATTPIAVLSPERGCEPRVSRRASAAIVPRRRLAVGAAQACDDAARRGVDDVAERVHRHERGDDRSARQPHARRCRSPPSSRGRGPSSLPTVAPAPAPTQPSATGPLVAAARRGVAGGRVGRIFQSPDAQVEQDRRRDDRHLHVARRRSRCPSPRGSASRPSRRRGRTPSRPESTIAWTCSTVLTGSRRSVSRVPGAPPRTSTPQTAPASASTTVQPVGRRESVKWPTRSPATSVRPPATRGRAFGGEPCSSPTPRARPRTATSPSAAEKLAPVDRAHVFSMLAPAPRSTGVPKPGGGEDERRRARCPLPTVATRPRAGPRSARSRADRRPDRRGDRELGVERRRPARQQPHDERHEERRRHHAVEELQRRRHRRQSSASPTLERARRRRPRAARRAAAPRRSAFGRSTAWIEVAAERGREHEEHRVGGRDLRGEERGEREAAEPRRQHVGREPRQRQLRVREARARAARIAIPKSAGTNANTASAAALPSAAHARRRRPSAPRRSSGCRPGETMNDGTNTTASPRMPESPMPREAAERSGRVRPGRGARARASRRPPPTRRARRARSRRAGSRAAAGSRTPRPAGRRGRSRRPGSAAESERPDGARHARRSPRTPTPSRAAGRRGARASPTQSTAAISTRTERSKRHSRKSPTVRNSCSAASRCSRGATTSPSTRQPIAAEPDHHQADRPVPIGEAGRAHRRARADVRGQHRREHHRRPSSERAATKNSLERLTWRDAQSPAATSSGAVGRAAGPGGAHAAARRTLHPHGGVEELLVLVHREAVGHAGDVVAHRRGGRRPARAGPGSAAAAGRGSPTYDSNRSRRMRPALSPIRTTR